jgi:hypothetical protein
MYLRFVTTRIDDDSHKPEGVFAAAYALLESGDLSPEERVQLREMLVWFNKYLSHPPKRFPGGRAIFWFRSSARVHIAQIWNLVHFLRLHGYYVEVYKCRRLANIC